MASTEAELELPCDPQRAWALVADLDAMPRWISGLHELRWKDEPPDAVGRHFVLDHTVGGQRSRHPADVVAWEPGRRWAWQVMQDQLDVQRSTELEATGTGTRVRLRLELRPCTVIARLGLPVFLHEARKRLHEDAARLRDQFGQ